MRMQRGSRLANVCCKKALDVVRREIFELFWCTHGTGSVWRMRRVAHVELREEKCSQDFSGEYEEKRQLGKTKLGLEHNIKTNF